MPKPRKKVDHGTRSRSADQAAAKKTARNRSPRTAEPGSRRSARGFRLKILGVGGAGGNAIRHISAAREEAAHLLDGATLLAVNTDLQSLETLPAAQRLQIGANITHGLGAGGDPELGARAARVDLERIEHAVQHADAVFVAAGLGGGTGGGAAPLVARLAREQGALVIGFVSLPFGFEGERRRQTAAACLEELKTQADAVICVPNDRLLKLADPGASALDVFKRCDGMIATAAQAVWQLMSRKGLINLDFASLRSTLQNRHSEGVFACGEGAGPDRVTTAVEQLLNHPLLDEDHALGRTDGLLVSILGGPDLTLSEVQEAVDPITRVAQRAHVMIGAAIDEAYRERISVTVIAASNRQPRKPVQRTPVTVPQEDNAAPEPAAEQPAAEQPADAAAANETAGAAVAKSVTAPHQEVLALDHVSRGRFDQSEPTIHEGQDLDVPTFLRQGATVN